VSDHRYGGAKALVNGEDEIVFNEDESISASYSSTYGLEEGNSCD
jgi:hypothetical protein